MVTGAFAGPLTIIGSMVMRIGAAAAIPKPRTMRTTMV